MTLLDAYYASSMSPASRATWIRILARYRALTGTEALDD